LAALGFVAQSTNMEGNFYVFAEFILATLVFIGAATCWRVQQTGLDDLVFGRGMGRIRAALLEVVPEGGAKPPSSDWSRRSCSNRTMSGPSSAAAT
jgi:hypothetical protein